MLSDCNLYVLLSYIATIRTQKEENAQNEKKISEKFVRNKKK